MGLMVSGCGGVKKPAATTPSKESGIQQKSTKVSETAQEIQESQRGSVTEENEVTQTSAIAPTTEPQVTEATKPTAQKETEATTGKPVEATLQTATFSVTMGEANNHGGLSYHVVVSNTSTTPQSVNSAALQLNKSSQSVGVNDSLPSQYSETRVIQPGESTTFANLLGPVSGDTPGYYTLTATYNGATIWSQEPQLSEAS